MEKYLTPNSLTHRSNVVLRVWCCHRPVECDIGSYPCGANDLTIWLKASTPDSLSPYIPLQILKNSIPLAEMTYSYSILISCGIFDVWIHMYWW